MQSYIYFYNPEILWLKIEALLHHYLEKVQNAGVVQVDNFG